MGKAEGGSTEVGVEVGECITKRVSLQKGRTGWPRRLVGSTHAVVLPPISVHAKPITLRLSHHNIVLSSMTETYSISQPETHRSQMKDLAHVPVTSVRPQAPTGGHVSRARRVGSAQSRWVHVETVRHSRPGRRAEMRTEVLL